MKPAIRRAVLVRDRSRCQRCGTYCTDPPHHRLLRSRGGTDDPANLVTLCRSCHMTVHMHPAQSIDDGWIWPGRVIRGVYVGPSDEAARAYGEAS